MTPERDNPLSNLHYMSAFTKAWPQPETVQQLVGPLPWEQKLLLHKTNNHLVVEYALRDVNKPMGVAEYNLAVALPADLKTSLPSIEQIERELGGEVAG